ncbi:MAG: hypothetical protein FJ387_06320 [Verrucomicrobia bacterium]|nr:hypothetical protein [Verrucomicrobiota bacterium]
MKSADEHGGADADIGPEPQGLRHRLAQRLGDWPLLRMLVLNLWFRVVFAGFVTVLILLILLVPKLWRVTPAGFLPEIRVNLLDLAQEWSLRRQAHTAVERGDQVSALAHWKGALAQNPANVDSLRGWLRAAGQGLMVEERPDAVRFGRLLFSFGATNQTDTELVARAWLGCGLERLAVELLDLRTNSLSEIGERVYAMALFHAGRTNDFRQRMRGLNGMVGVPETAFQVSELEPEDQRFRLYCLSDLALWGQPGERQAARQQLRQAQEAGSYRRLALELQFLAAVYESDPAGCAALLKELEEVGAATAVHQAGYWAILIQTGHRALAKELVGAAALVPGNPLEAHLLGQVQLELGMLDEANLVLDRFGGPSVWASEVHALHARVLTKQENWKGLLRLVTHMRALAGERAGLGSFADCLEGFAHWGEGRRELAKSAFRRAATAGIPRSDLSLWIAGELMVRGAFSEAEGILVPQLGRLADDPEYLRMLSRCGYYLRKSAYLWEAITKLRSLAPSDPLTEQHYAATLVALRRNPEEAVRLTLEALKRFPNRAEAVICHAGALVLNRRVAEAQTLLDNVRAEALPPMDRAQFEYWQFEIHLQEGRIDKAWVVRDRIDTALLFPEQARWLATAIKQMGGGLSSEAAFER